MQDPILVTGHHRSGSTWVGRMIAASGDVGYIHEPFNPNHRPGVCSANTSRYFFYVPEGDEGQWRDALRRTLSFQYDFTAELREISSVKDLLRMVRDASIFQWHKTFARRPLMKDPIALLSADWIYDNFQPKVVCLIRHPAAFASSLKRLNWKFPFEHLSSQEILLNEKLSPFSEKIRHYQLNERDIVEEACLLWSIFSHVIHMYENKYSKWLFVKHEDICNKPIEEFRKIYEYLNINYTKKEKSKIKKYSYKKNNTEVEDGVIHDIRMDSRSLIKKWKERLSEKDIDKVREKTKSYWELFYSEKDW